MQKEQLTLPTPSRRPSSQVIEVSTQTKDNSAYTLTSIPEIVTCPHHTKEPKSRKEMRFICMSIKVSLSS